MRAFSIKGISTKGFFGPNALTLGNPFPTPSGGGGATWATLTTGFEASTDFYIHINFLNNLFIIATNDNNQQRKTVIVSPDGTTWSQHFVANTAAGFRSEGVAFGGGIYLFLVDTGIAAPHAYTSPDLTTWTIRNGLGFASGVILNPPTFGNGVFLLTAQGGSDYATSPDGATWTHHANYVPTSWNVAPIFDGTQFVAPVLGTGAAPKLAASLDGIHWTESAATLDFSGPNNVANNGTTQYIVGDGGSDSGDSLNSALTTATLFSFNDSGNGTESISFGDGRWTRCNTNDSNMRSSSDGETWTIDTVETAASFFIQIAFGLSRFIAIGGDTLGNNYTASRTP